MTLPDGHLTVDILGQSSVWTWLGPVLAFAGTLILFAASMITLWRSNKAADTRSKADRIETQNRDFRLWQRDNMLRVSSDIVESAIEVEDEYTMLAHSPEPLANNWNDKIDRLERKVAASAASLRIAGAQDEAKMCVALRNAMNSRDLVRTIAVFNVAYRSEKNALGTPEGASSSDEFQQRIAILRIPVDFQMAPLYAARYQFEKTVEHELRTLNLPTASSNLPGGEPIATEAVDSSPRSNLAPKAEVADRVVYAFLAVAVEEHSGPAPFVSVDSPGIDVLVSQTFPTAFALYVVGSLEPGNEGAVTAALSPAAEMGGSETVATRQLPPIVGPDFQPLPPPTFVVGLNPWVSAPGLHRVLVSLEGEQIADLPLDLRLSAPR